MSTVEHHVLALAAAAQTLDETPNGGVPAADGLATLRVLASVDQLVGAIRDRLVHELQAAPQHTDGHASWGAIADALGEPQSTVYGRWRRATLAD